VEEEWTCGHVAGAMCQECYRLLAQRAHELAEENLRLKTLDPILTEREYMDWLGISAPTAQRQRSEGSGPPFVQLSERRIGYRRSAVEQWLRERTVVRIDDKD